MWREFSFSIAAVGGGTDSQMSEHLECCLANDAASREAIYRLRYACYRRKGSIPAREDQRFTDEFDAAPNSFSFLVRSGDHQAVATVRVSVVDPSRGWTDSPVQHVYPDQPALQNIAQESFVEASRLCFREQARRDAFVKLLGNMAALADVYEAAWLVACPRVEHAAVYQRLFGFRPLAEPRQYFGVSFQTQLLATRKADLHAYVRGIQPIEAAWLEARKRLWGRSAAVTP